MSAATTRSMKARKNKRLVVTLSSVGAALAIVLVIFLFMNSYYRDNYATKKYVVDALANSGVQVSDAEMGRIADQITKDLNASLGEMDVENLTDEQLKALLSQVRTYLESEFTGMAKEQIESLASDLVKAELNKTLKNNNVLIKKYQAQIDDLNKQTKELQKLLEQVNNYSYSDIYDVVKKYGMSEDDVKQFLSAYETANNAKLKELADKLGVSTTQLTQLISQNASSDDSKIKDVANKLGITEKDLKQLINNYNSSLTSRIDSLQAYTINSDNTLRDSLPSYTITTDSNAKTSVVMTIPSSHK